MVKKRRGAAEVDVRREVGEMGVGAGLRREEVGSKWF